MWGHREYRGVFGGYHEYPAGYLEYHEGYSVPWGYHDVRGGILSTMGIFSTVEDTILCNLSTVGGYHDTCGNIMSTVVAVQYRGGTQITKDFPPWYS